MSDRLETARPYRIVGTGQTRCFDNTAEIAPPRTGQPFYGQDAQCKSHPPHYRLSDDGLTVHDDNTGLTWQRSPVAIGSHAPGVADKLTFTQAPERPAALNVARFGGYDDWRLPSVKELYSLIQFSGVDVSDLMSAADAVPFIDTDFFRFAYGDLAAGERAIDSQWVTTTTYVANPGQMFGVNFADGRIKGYPTADAVGKKYFVLCVRGNPAYGQNDFRDGGDGTIEDRATGLVWSKADSGKGVNWEEALAFVQQRNAENYLGHSDWRMPDAKELHSIVDYTRAPAVTGSPAIDPSFETTRLDDGDYPFFWTGTTHRGGEEDGPAGAAVYIAFGRATGWRGPSGTSPTPPSGEYRLTDVHGAGAQRSDPKAGDPTQFVDGRGPQGDVIRIYNYVRLVRGGDV